MVAEEEGGGGGPCSNDMAGRVFQGVVQGPESVSMASLTCRHGLDCHDAMREMRRACPYREPHMGAAQSQLSRWWKSRPSFSCQH